MAIYDINGNKVSGGGIDEAITPEMTTFITEEKSLLETEKNLLFGAVWTDKKFWNNGYLFPSTTHACVEKLIPVTPGTVYVKNRDGATAGASGCHANFFDSDGVNLGNCNWTGGDSFYRITAPVNAASMGFNSTIEKRDFEWIFSMEDYAEYVSGGTETKYFIDNLNVIDKELPRLYLIGDTTGMSKDNKVKLSYKYVRQGVSRNKNGWCTVKWQGDSSLGRDKKNYTVVFYHDPEYERKEKIEFMDGIVQSKWVAKAYYDDPSRFKNNLAAKLWGQIVKCRSNIPTELEASPNYGAIDGYPILLYINDEFTGLYMFNVPKDDFTFGMDSDNPLHCCAYGNGNNDGKENPANNVLSAEFRLASVAGWDNEVPEKWTESTQSGLIALINFVMTASDEEFKANLDSYLDVKSALDYYSFMYLFCATDSLANNMILLTYNGGQKWYCSAYDMDSILGTEAWGAKNTYDTPCPEGYNDTNSLLWQRIETVFGQELYDEYRFLRGTVLSIENIENEMTIFTEAIGDANYMREFMKWGSGVNQLDTLKEFIENRAEYVDAEFEAFNTAT
jgi:hypothetical protein